MTARSGRCPYNACLHLPIARYSQSWSQLMIQITNICLQAESMCISSSFHIIWPTIICTSFYLFQPVFSSYRAELTIFHLLDNTDHCYPGLISIQTHWRPLSLLEKCPHCQQRPKACLNYLELEMSSSIVESLPEDFWPLRHLNW